MENGAEMLLHRCAELPETPHQEEGVQACQCGDSSVVRGIREWGIWHQQKLVDCSCFCEQRPV